MIIDLLKEKIDMEYYNIVKETPYLLDNHYVPRVTSILSDMLHVDSLMGWSNYLGFKRQRYSQVLQEAADKGSLTHNSIEQYIQNNQELDVKNIPVQYQTAVRNAYNSFISWWNIILQNKVEIIYQEQPLICKWFGGTLDLLLKINGKIYLFDFKTSNHPSYKYFLQLSAYRYMLKELYNIEIGGCGIIMLSKDNISFEEIIIDLDDDDDYRFIEHCKETFFSLVYSYYNRLLVEQEFNKIIKRIS
jgi:hypothetical protein